MSPRLRDRIDYGRAIRLRALCLVEAHGHAAEAVVREACAQTGLPVAERCFLAAVAVRLARLAAAPAFRLPPDAVRSAPPPGRPRGR